MALVLRMLYKQMQRFDAENKDLRTEDFLLMGSPLKITGVILCYLVFIKKLGPAIMQNRKPYNLKYVMLIYNALQVLANIYCAYRCTYPIYVHEYYQDRGCMMPDLSNSPQGLNEIRLVHMYFLLKVADFLDTIFFVLRRKYSQVSFLHVYHHIAMAIGTYAGVRYIGGGHVSILGYVNMFVHTIMYSYYFISALRPSMQNSLWWKKYITQLQILQFLTLIVHFARPILHKDCKQSKILMGFFVMQGVFLLSMFSDFYIRTYLRKSKVNYTKNHS